jgi:hypothetical protein
MSKQILKGEHFLCLYGDSEMENFQSNFGDLDISNEKIEEILIDFVNENDIESKDYIIISSDFLKNFEKIEENFLSEILRVKFK